MMNRFPDKAIVLLAVLMSLAGGCDLAYPETVVVNKLDQHVLVRSLSFNGCLWNSVLAYGDATSPGRCLPGEDRVHFEKFDAAAYCQEQADDGTIAGVCNCDPDQQPDDNPMDPGLINEVPIWFNYQTISSFRAGYREFHIFEITSDDIEQDFSVPGPYGH
ncbi:MAG TPA: hypothetical protein VM425_21930 [Myxococcota bacterium]|nr:hypothetical protein [Myxococcota bacterium]